MNDLVKLADATALAANMLQRDADAGKAVRGEIVQELREAAALLRAAAGADVQGLMGMVQEFASAWSLVGGVFDSGDGLERAEELRTALESALRLALTKGQP